MESRKALPAASRSTMRLAMPTMNLRPRSSNSSCGPVKVDRDERPDIDARYQMAVSALTGQGGWPLTAFLTPDGKPFYGGTYFPPDDYYGRPGMRRVLESISHSYRTHKADVFASADR